jgi:hypothetical protein
VQAWNAAGGKKLWEVTVFRNWVKPWLEADVQHVYIARMSIRAGGLVVISERRTAYRVDLKTRKVTQ